MSIHPEKLQSLESTFRTLKFTIISSDLHRQYTAFCSDFGPVNLGVVHRFCRAMASKLAALDKSNRVLVYCIEPTTEALANASFLLAAFLHFHAGYAPADAAAPFCGPGAPFSLRPFRDATFTPQVRTALTLSIIDNSES